MWLFAASLQAQAAWIEEDPLSVPIAIVDAGRLTPGAFFEIRVQARARWTGPPFGGYAPHPVVAIRDGESAQAITIAGADGCYTPSAPPGFVGSCVRFEVPADVGTRNWFVWIRAWATGHEGLAQVDLYAARNATGPVIRRLASLTPMGEVSFGGLAHMGLGDTAPTYQFETAEAPGAPESRHRHVVMFALQAGDPAVDWFLLGGAAGLARGNIHSHRSSAGGTAQYSGAAPFGNPPLGLTADQYTIVGGAI